MTRLILTMALSMAVLPACIHSMSMRSADGESLSGQYRFSSETTGLIRIIGGDGEVLTGKFVTVGRGAFVESYRNTFGTGSIIVDGPDVSGYGNPFGGIFGGSHALTDSAYGETFDITAGNFETGVRGPLFYWTASLRGNKGTTIGCHFIGSSYTGHGFGRCKNHTGKEYTLEF
jgi:hypothetical protein